jgi:hypothetical protein
MSETYYTPRVIALLLAESTLRREGSMAVEMTTDVDDISTDDARKVYRVPCFVDVRFAHVQDTIHAIREMES